MKTIADLEEKLVAKGRQHFVWVFLEVAVVAKSNMKSSDLWNKQDSLDIPDVGGVQYSDSVPIQL